LLAVPAVARPFNITPLATYQHASADGFDQSAAEIVAHDPASQRFFVVNAEADRIDVLALDDSSLQLEPDEDCEIDLERVNGVQGFTLGGPNSVAVQRELVAVALEDANKQSPGRVAVYRTSDCTFWDSYPTGALPDMVTFTPDGEKLVVANEGEPSDDYGTDPEGSVTIIDLGSEQVQQLGFTAFNDARDALVAQGVRIFGPGATVAQDLEPEYVAVSADSSTAWVALQENNAIATVDLEAAEIVAISALGTKDFNQRGNELDYTNRDEQANIVQAPYVGMYQPDAIATLQRGSRTYLVTANEGDARDYDGYSEEVRVDELQLDPALVQAYPGFADEDDLGRPKTTIVDGDTNGDRYVDTVHLYGARSISIWQVQRDGQLTLVGDSGSTLEQAVAEQYPALFNASNDEDGLDDRSDDKGPEPEALSVVTIGNKPYALVGLERSSQVALFDLSNLRRPRLVQLVSNRVNGALGLDLGPESVIYIKREDSPIGIPLMAVANEVSGTTTLYTIQQ
jgi:DNA-binding beta-propeller fold protein YncE